MGDLVLTPPEPRTLTPMDLLDVATRNGAAIDVIERLAALQEKQMNREAEIDFNEAMNRCQGKIPRIVPRFENKQTNSKYASYTDIDKVIRPVYLAEGLSLSFTTVDCPIPDHVRIVCYASLRGYTRTYQVDLAADGKGAKGGDVMTKTHASGAAMTYGKRYLVNLIFNLSIGEEDTDGTNGELAERIEWLANASSKEELKKLYIDAYNKFESSPSAIKALIDARNKKREEF